MRNEAKLPPVDCSSVLPNTALGLPPVELVALAAKLECPYLGIVLSTRPFNPHEYPPYSLLEDAALRRRMIAAMA